MINIADLNDVVSVFGFDEKAKKYAVEVGVSQTEVSGAGIKLKKQLH